MFHETKTFLPAWLCVLGLRSGNMKWLPMLLHTQKNNHRKPFLRFYHDCFSCLKASRLILMDDIKYIELNLVDVAQRKILKTLKKKMLIGI